MTQTNEPKADAAADERREQIKRAALKVFAKHGIDGTKMSMIASEAGISQGLSYRYFSSKEEIFTLLVEEAIDEAQAAIAAIGQLPGSPKEQFKAFTQKMLDAHHKYYFMLIQHAMSSGEVPAQAKQAIERYSPNETIDRLVPLFVRGQQTGEFCDGDPHTLLLLYLSVISGLMLQDFPDGSDFFLQQVDMLMKIILK